MTKKISSGLKMKTMTIGLTKKQICYLDDLSKSSRFTGGKKLSRISILRSLLLACKKVKIDIDGVKSEEELYERVLLAFEREQ